jgi:hypothetical protein
VGARVLARSAGIPSMTVITPALVGALALHPAAERANPLGARGFFGSSRGGPEVKNMESQSALNLGIRIIPERTAMVRGCCARWRVAGHGALLSRQAPTRARSLGADRGSCGMGLRRWWSGLASTTGRCSQASTSSCLWYVPSLT